VQNQDAKYGSSIKGKGKMQGRAIYRAYDENQGKAKDAVLKAIKMAADKLNATATVKG
jgi:hypothetical protein